MYYQDAESDCYYYYKWILFFLSFQTSIFFLPHFLWKSWEEKRINQLIAHRAANFIPNRNRRNKDNLVYIIENLDETIRHNENNTFLWKYLICVFLNCIGLLGQIYLVSLFLGSEFTTYGIQQKKFRLHGHGTSEDEESQAGLLARMFPQVVNCISQLYQQAPLTALNAFNDKILLFLWFWFVCLFSATVMDVLSWSCTMFSRKLRIRSLVTLVQNPISAVYRRKIELLVTRCSVGDWFLLHLIGKNLDESTFKSLIFGLCILQNVNSEAGN